MTIRPTNAAATHAAIAELRGASSDGRLLAEVLLHCAMDDRDGDRAAPAQDRLTLTTLAGAAGLGELVPVPRRFHPSVSEAGTEHLIEALSLRLRQAHSATAVLEAWCAERGLAPEPQLVAERVPGPVPLPSPLQRARLAIGPDEPLRYRRVRLTCAGLVLSEAENWYVPARLTPAMNAVLEASQTPFGRVVHPLAPLRRHLSLLRLWRPVAEEWPAAGEPLFRVEAVLSTGSGLPFCEVAETYTGAVLTRGAR